MAISLFRTTRHKRYRPGNKVVVGSTGSGKSYSENHDVIDAALSDEVAIVVVDPHSRALAWSVFCHLVARGFGNRILFDQLNYFDRVLGYHFLRQPTTRNPYLRESLIEMTSRRFADILMRRRGMASLASAPQTEEYTIKAGMLLLHQPQQQSASDLKYAFQPQHPKFRQLIRDCTHEEVQYTFSLIEDGTIKPAVYAPARRLVEGVCNSPAFAVRCGTSFDLYKFLDQRGILLLEGGTHAVSQDTLQTILGTVMLDVINYVRSRRRSTPRVLIVADEATNANLIGTSGYEVRSMNECRKMGLDWHVLVQSLNFQSSYVTDAVLQNCTRHEWFYCANNAVAQQAAADLGDSDYRGLIRQLATGQRYVKDRNRVFHEQVPPLPDPWVFPRLNDQKANAFLQQIRQRPEYWSPPCSSPTSSNSSAHGGQAEGPSRQPGANETRRSSDSPTNTLPPPDISSDCSPARRLRTGG
jgi:hypothetical protein